MAVEKIIRVCKQCGVVFEPKYPTWAEAKRRKFCSRTCASRSRVQVPKRYRHVGGDRVHRARAEAALGHPLPKGAQVHHADGTKSDRSPLVICQDAAYHSLLHRRMRIKAAGGNPNTDAVCGRCGAVKSVSEFTRRASSGSGLCPICRDCSTATNRIGVARRRVCSQTQA